MNDPAWAWAHYEPDAARPWDLRLAGHLYRRAGFGATWDQLQAALIDGPQATIDKLLHAVPEVAAFNQVHDGYEQTAAQSSGGVGPQAWWLRRMCETPHPLLEQMTLFWHNHFAVSDLHVNNPALMCRYFQVLRQHALGDFGALLEGVASQPATFVCADARASRKARPNENFPRVLLEHFTVGPGQFTETEVQATARALTGWFVSLDELQYSAREHVTGQTTLFGEAGDFEKQDIIARLLRQPATARLVVRELYRWLISETATPPDSLLAPLARAFAKDHDISALVETMLRSNLFFSLAAYRQKIKSPVEFALGIVRPLGGVIGTMRLASDLADLGQDLYRPPTLNGWAGGRCWINRYTVLGRIKLAQALLASAGPYGGKLDPFAAAARHGRQGLGTRNQFLFDLLLQEDLVDQVREALVEGEGRSEIATQAGPAEQFRHVATAIAALPEFNLA